MSLQKGFLISPICYDYILVHSDMQNWRDKASDHRDRKPELDGCSDIVRWKIVSHTAHVAQAGSHEGAIVKSVK